MNISERDVLTHTALAILLALSLKPRHGYELMQQIILDSGKHITIGPATLYGTLKKLTAENYIEEMPFENSKRRRYYRLTKRGWDRLQTEMKYYQRAVELATTRHVFSR